MNITWTKYCWFQISTATPGITPNLDFRCSDLWAAGTLAYEILAGANPFYTDLYDSRNYSEAELPRLPASVPGQVAKVVYNMLSRDPQKVGIVGAIKRSTSVLKLLCLL